jgi:peptide/nickel transport system substrate-binding protein
MRWALNYLIDRKEIVNVAYEGSTSISFTPFPYYTPLKKLVEANLSDMAAKVTTYDPKLAYAIFEKKGYKRNKANFWEKDGKVLSITLQAHAAYVEMKKIPMVVVEQWQRGGVDAVLRVLEGTNWSENLNNGTFEASCGWQSCGSVNEPWASLEQYNIKYFKPIGERASTNYWRWSNQPFSDLVDKIGTLPLESPEIIPLFKQAMTILYDEMPVIYVTQARKILPQNSTYWTNWPTADNPYSHPPSWWPIVHFILQNVQKAK